jgi:hypothetical protein
VTRSLGGERAERPVGGLGYRGFLLHHDGSISELPPTVLVFAGVVTDNPGPRAIAWKDVAGAEEWLLDDARRRDYGEILEAGGAPKRS